MITAYTDSTDMSIYSDMHKDCYGFRPRHCPEYVDEYLKATKMLQKRLSREMYETNLMEQESIKQFEAKVQQIIDLGAGHRSTAIEWLLEEYNRDTGFLEYEFGLPYGYIK